MAKWARVGNSGDRGGICTRTGAVTAQPRPALGRRPWFALLRLARNLRRFALVMAGRLPGRRMTPAVVRVDDPASGWTSPPVVVARTFRRRLTGLRPWTLGVGLLLPGGRITGRGMAEPLRLVGVAGDGRVTGVETLETGSSVELPSATMILELDIGHPAPSVGATLRIRPMLAPCRGD